MCAVMIELSGYIYIYIYVELSVCVNSIQAATVRHEMLLLSNMLQLDDSLWEQRVRCGQTHSVFHH